TPYTLQGQMMPSGNPPTPYAAPVGTVQSPPSPYQSGASAPASAAETTPRPFTRLSEMKRASAPLPPPSGTDMPAASSTVVPASAPVPATLPPLAALKG